MTDTAGVLAIVVGVLFGAALVWRWRALPPIVALGGEAIAGAVLAVGGLAVQEDVNLASWVSGPLLLAGLATLHAFALFGRPGRSRGADPLMVVAGAFAAYKERNP